MSTCDHQYEVSSPIDTVEVCIKCGHRIGCEPQIRDRAKKSENNPLHNSKKPVITESVMRINALLITSLAMAAASTGWSWGIPLYCPARSGGMYHHSGCRPNSAKAPKSRPQKGGFSQRQIRKDRRRAFAAGNLKAFA